jgi:hypothetical protein
MNPLHVVLAISLAANAALGWAYLGQRDTATVATTETKQADGVAKACSDGVKALSNQAAKRHKEAAPKVEAARQQAEDAGKLAIEIISTPAAVPGDACASSQAALDAWWTRKAQP